MKGTKQERFERLENLTLFQRKVLRYYWLQNHTLEQTAEYCKCSRSWVEACVKTLKRKLGLEIIHNSFYGMKRNYIRQVKQLLREYNEWKNEKENQERES